MCLNTIPFWKFRRRLLVYLLYQAFHREMFQGNGFLYMQIFLYHIKARYTLIRKKWGFEVSAPRCMNSFIFHCGNKINKYNWTFNVLQWRQDHKSWRYLSGKIKYVILINEHGTIYDFGEHCGCSWITCMHNMQSAFISHSTFRAESKIFKVQHFNKTGSTNSMESASENCSWDKRSRNRQHKMRRFI